MPEIGEEYLDLARVGPRLTTEDGSLSVPTLIEAAGLLGVEPATVPARIERARRLREEVLSAEGGEDEDDPIEGTDHAPTEGTISTEDDDRWAGALPRQDRVVAAPSQKATTMPDGDYHGAIRDRYTRGEAGGGD